jgi:hypothetical protein
MTSRVISTSRLLEKEKRIEALAKLAVSQDYLERKTAASDPNCPPDLLVKLSQDTSWDAIAWAAWENPALPEDEMERLIDLITRPIDRTLTIQEQQDKYRRIAVPLVNNNGLSPRIIDKWLTFGEGTPIGLLKLKTAH